MGKKRQQMTSHLDLWRADIIRRIIFENKKGIYCRPVSLVQEGVDSVVPPNRAFQITARRSCTVPAKYLRKLRQELSCEDKRPLKHG